MTDTFCILPWIHFYANPDGNVLPCCIGEHHNFMGSVQTNTIEEVWNNDIYKEMRVKMLKGERCSQCSACHQSEDNGIQSFRQSVNDKFKKHLHLADATNPDGSLDQMNLKYFDIRWSNICNFKCRSCSSTYSSSWATEDNANGQEKKVFIFAGGKTNDSLYEQFLPHFKNMEEIYFAGGEPLLTDKHYDILEHLISIGKTDVSLRYNSNLSTLKYKDKSVIDMWKKFSNVELCASLDSWGDRAEYVREGTDWKLIEDNIRLIRKEVPHVRLEMTSVISVFTVNTLPEFLDYLFKNKLFDQDRFFPNFYNLITPYFYSTNVMPDELRASTITKLTSALSLPYNNHIKQQLKNVIAGLENAKFDADLHSQFKKQTAKFDAIRNRDFANTFPELDNLNTQ